MDQEIIGISLKRIIETTLALLGMIFLLVEGHNALEQSTLLSIMVVVYLLIIVILNLANRNNTFGAGGLVAMECVFGVLLLMYNIQELGGKGRSSSGSGLSTAAYIMEIVVGAMFLIFSLF